MKREHTDSVLLEEIAALKLQLRDSKRRISNLSRENREWKQFHWIDGLGFIGEIEKQLLADSMIRKWAEFAYKNGESPWEDAVDNALRYLKTRQHFPTISDILSEFSVEDGEKREPLVWTFEERQEIADTMCAAWQRWSKEG